MPWCSLQSGYTDKQIIDSLLINSSSFNPSGLSIDLWQYANINKNEISEILEFDNIYLLINSNKLDEFLFFITGKRGLLIERKIRNKNVVFGINNEEFYILKANIRKTIMKNGNSYFLYRSINF